MPGSTLHVRVRKGDLEGVRTILAGGADPSARNERGKSPLHVALESSSAGPEMIRLLLNHGAQVGPFTRDCVFKAALKSGDPEKLAVILAAGAEILGADENGYDALIHAVYGGGPRLLEVLNLLLSRGAPLDRITRYNESALGVLSHRGRFDAVGLLLKAGANPQPLGWTPLHQAAALGSTSDLERELRNGAPLEGRDAWERTAFLLSVTAGHVENASLLRERGADIRARGRRGKTALQLAVESHRLEMLRWLLGILPDVEEKDDFGATALMVAAEHGDAESVGILLETGANADARTPITLPKEALEKFPAANFGTRLMTSALARTSSREVALKLLEAGSDPADLTSSARREMFGLPEAGDLAESDVSPEDFARARNRRFGTRNPEAMDEPFWIAMIRSGWSGYHANQFLQGPSSQDQGPVWCASRFGQSITLLPDGRAVLIAGEHEDSYDPDFCIYNDVFVREVDGSIHIFGYPREIFPPTDFHTATLLGEWIYVIGSLGYFGKREFGRTPVYRLNTRTFAIERLDPKGEAPGWIHRHRATIVSPREIRVSGGGISRLADGREDIVPNDLSFVLEVEALTWRRE
jgi:ankyrin repeat protein